MYICSLHGTQWCLKWIRNVFLGISLLIVFQWCDFLIGPSTGPISRVHTSLFGCLALEVTEFASPRAEKDLGLMSVMGAGSTGTTGSLASAPYPLLWALRRRRALGGEATEADRSLQRGCSGMLKRCTVRKMPQVSAEKK